MLHLNGLVYYLRDELCIDKQQPTVLHVEVEVVVFGGVLSEDLLELRFEPVFVIAGFGVVGAVGEGRVQGTVGRRLHGFFSLQTYQSFFVY